MRVLFNGEMAMLIRERSYLLENMINNIIPCDESRKKFQDLRDGLIELINTIGWDFMGEEPPK